MNGKAGGEEGNFMCVLVLRETDKGGRWAVITKIGLSYWLPTGDE